jgi:DNA-binding transcriptional regulator YhcF (GntR family)
MSAKAWKSNRHWLSPGEMPLYQQVQVIIATRIATGELSIGERLPSEDSLSEILGVSRSTLRLALAEFEREGLIERTPRRGTFLRQMPPPRATELARRRVNRTDLINGVSKGRLVRRGYEVPPSVVLRELEIPAGETVFYILRVIAKFKGGRGAIKRYFRDESSSGGKLGCDTKAVLHGEFSHGWIEAIAAEPRFAGLLGVDLSVPLISVWWVERIANTPLICSHLVVAGEQMTFCF